jgi:hypothetical protein
MSSGVDRRIRSTRRRRLGPWVHTMRSTQVEMWIRG